MENLRAFLADLIQPQQSSAIVPTGTLAAEFAGLFDDVKIYQAERKQRQRKREKDGTPFQPLTDAERKERRKVQREHKAEQQKQDDLQHIAVLDFETDPFDEIERERIVPFCACLYSDQFSPITIWDENEQSFISKVIAAIESLPEAFTIYAHNGGKFDFMFLLHRIRGEVSFKGRAIMQAKIGRHTLRDSYHIIPEKLATYKKDDFDYGKLKKARRNKFRADIEKYILSDCRNLFEIVSAFVRNYGMKISIGQCAFMLMKRTYPQFENVSEKTDEFLRDYFFGGRVECFQGRGEFKGDYKLYDVNSMYPFVMATKRHPIGRRYIPRVGDPNSNTAFVNLNCRSFGAFPVKEKDVGTTFPYGVYGKYRVSIHEYEIALKYNLIDRVRINYCVDNELQTDFSDFIVPLYSNRLITKAELERLGKLGLEDSDTYADTKRDDIFFKLLMNNAYGKTAQNPRRFKEYHLTDFGGKPEIESATWGLQRNGELLSTPEFQCSDYAIWSRPIKKFRFLNVGCAASITGAARAQLLEAKMNAVDPIYCDTDSIICRELNNVPLSKTQLGAWDLEAPIEHCIIAGKKLYAYNHASFKKPKVRAKGVAGISWDDMARLAQGEFLIVPAKAPTLTRTGSQAYIDRTIRATTPVRDQPKVKANGR